MEEEHETSSLRARRKKSSVSLACCFNGHRRADSFDVSSSSSSASPSARISPSAWIRSKTNDLPDIKIKGRYKNLMSRMGRHRRHSSADFSYDPLSYSLNFEDSDHNDNDSSEVEDFPIRSFAARLPLSPPRVVNGVSVPPTPIRPKLMPAAAAPVPAEAKRRNLELEEVSSVSPPILVVSPTSRQVLVELC